MNENEALGYLRVKVSYGTDAFPVEGAVVLISPEKNSGEENGVVYSLRTDLSGLTESVALETESKDLTEIPGGARPYKTYSVLVDKGGFYPVNISGVSIFEGISATLPVNLVPVDYERGSTVNIDLQRREETF